jgi:hypothetical protein
LILNRVKFLFIRLQRSSSQELWHRCSELFLTHYLRLQSMSIFGAHLPDIDIVKSIYTPVILGGKDEGAIKLLLQGAVCFNQETQSINRFEEKWRDIFYPDVIYCSDDPDIRSVWEKGRLQNLSLLLQVVEKAGGKAGKIQEIDFVRSGLLQWLKGNPFGYGPHYISVMECGLRMPLFLRALLVVDSWSPEEAQQIVQAIYQHGWFIRKRLSLYSSLGNHTIAECVGLVFAGFLFLEKKEGAEWLKKGIELLEQECSHQILPDGGPAEQSFSYHRLVLDLYWLAIDFLEKNALHNCTELKRRVILGEAFLSVMQKTHEPALQIGDSDDGHAVGPGLYPAIRDNVTGVIDDRPVTTFPDAGYTVMRTLKGVRLVIDHGQLGMAPLYNHGHADALSVLLSIRDVEFLVDPGTYQYNGDQQLRRYFKGTRAHNTVAIDGCDQAEQLTSFVWGKPYTLKWAGVQNNDNQEYLVASHNGYCRLCDPVTHVRKFLWLDDEAFLIEDSFEGGGKHTFELNFHLHPDVVVETTQKGFLLQNGAQSLGIALVDEQFEVVQGAEDPLCGWYSPSYGVVEKTTTLQFRQEGNAADVRFRTLLHIGGEVSEKLIEQVIHTCDIQF